MFLVSVISNKTFLEKETKEVNEIAVVIGASRPQFYVNNTMEDVL